MRHIIFKYNTGFCGSEGIATYVADDTMTDEDISMEAHWSAIEHDASYGIYPKEETGVDENGDLVNDDEVQYSSGIEGCWNPYNPKKARWTTSWWWVI